MPPHRSSSSGGLSDASLRSLEAIIARFEDAWSDGEVPAIAAFLPDEPSAQRRYVLVELVHVDLEFRLKSGEAARVETYLQTFPELAADRETVCELIQCEFELRSRSDPDCKATEYLSRFPEYAPELQTRLPASGPLNGGRAAETPAVADQATRDFLPSDQQGTVSHVEAVPRKAARSSQDRLPAVPGYKVVRVLGRGGMGVVYQAHQVQLKRPVALKMILAGHLAGADERARFHREAEAVARLRHPNIVQVYEIGEYDGRPYFSLEFVEGGALDKKLARTPQPPREAAHLVEVLAHAMHHAHEQHILHRDLKPANVLLTADGTPKITDFGLAKQLDTEEMGQTQAGAVMGTPSYMAPEQAAGKIDELGPAADTYALGALLYEMFTGQPPFKGTTLYDTLDLVQHTDPVPPRQLQPKIPRDLETICLKCLQKEPQQRYPSAAALAEDLHRFLAGEPIHARPVGALERVVKWMRRHPARAALVAALVLIGIFAVGGVFYHQEQKLQQYERVARQRTDAETAYRHGLDRARGSDRDSLEQARLSLTQARTVTAEEPELEGLRQDILQALADVEGKLEAQQNRRAAETRAQRLRQLDDEILFRELLLTEGDQGANLRDMRRLTAEALEQYQVRAGQDFPARVPSFFSVEERTEILETLYELLLTRAEALAQPLPGSSEQPAAQAEAALAVLELTQALTRHPLLRDAGLSERTEHQRRARYLQQSGKEEAAEAEKRRAEALSAAGATDHFLAARVAYQAGQFRPALRECDAVLALRPQHFGARLVQAGAYAALNEWLAAQVSLDDCLRARPQFLWPRVVRAYVAGERALVLADKSAVEAEELFAAAAKDYEYVLGRQPDAFTRYAAHVNRSYLCIRRGQYDRAVADLQTAIALKPEQFNAYVNLARALRGQQKWDEAVTQLDQAITLEPRLAGLYRTRAQLHLLRHDPAKALPDLEEAIAHEPPDSKAPEAADDHVERGKLLQQRGQFAEALRSYEAALRKRPDHATALRLQADVLLELKRPGEALEVLDRFIAKGKAPAEVFRMRGVVRARQRDFRGAIADYTVALKMKDDTPTLLLRGWAYLAHDAAKLALADFEEVLKKAPEDAEACAGRGCSRVMLGKVADGVKDAERARRQPRLAAETVYNLARLYAQAGEKLESAARNDGRAQEQRSRYQDLALQLLRQAVESQPLPRRGGFWEDVRLDPALKPVRRHQGFVQLDAHFSRPSGKE